MAAIKVTVLIQEEVPPNTDPILKLVPILQKEGYTLIGNGVATGVERYLLFEMPDD